MRNNISINNLDSLYSQGQASFIKDMLKEKADKGQNVVYSINGNIIILTANEAMWLYEKLSNGLDESDIAILSQTASQGGNIVYELDHQYLTIPAQHVLDMFNNINVFHNSTSNAHFFLNEPSVKYE